MNSNIYKQKHYPLLNEKIINCSTMFIKKKYLMRYKTDSNSYFTLKKYSYSIKNYNNQIL